MSKPKSDKKDQSFYSLGRKSGWFTVNVSFSYASEAGRSQNVFSWEWENQGLLFFAFPKPKRGDWRGTPKQKLKTIEVVFIYSKRSTGFWYCEKFQGPGRISGTKNCDQNLSVFFFPNIFQSLSKFQERTSGTVTVKNSKVLSLKIKILHENELK